MRTPVRDVLPDSQGAWVRVGDGWLTGRASPESKEEFTSWGADVVVSLQYACEGGGIAHGIVAAVVSARALAYHYVRPVHRNIWKSPPTLKTARSLPAPWWPSTHICSEATRWWCSADTDNAA